jgi:hypothetical protein
MKKISNKQLKKLAKQVAKIMIERETTPALSMDVLHERRSAKRHSLTRRVE